MKRLLILFIVSSFILGCEEESSVNSSLTNDSCNFQKSLEKVNELIDKCNDNQFNSISEIKENLIGDWTLSAIKSDWVDFEPASECLLLSISAESLILKNLETGEEFNSAWNLITYEVNGYVVFYLKPDDEKLRWSVGMQFFSESIMYGMGLADDTDTYVYEKMK